MCRGRLLPCPPIAPSDHTGVHAANDDAQTMSPLSVMHVDCRGVDHADFSADLRFLVASCEFGHRLLQVGWKPRIEAVVNSPRTRATVSTEAFSSALRRLGRTTVKTARGQLAPQLRAASTSFASACRSPDSCSLARRRR